MKNNWVVISLGSNINPELNIMRAKQEIDKICKVFKESHLTNTQPLLYIDQPDFLNGALLVKTELDFVTLKQKLKGIEIKLGRTKGTNRNGPRIIDLDILIYDGTITDHDIFERDFLKESVLELLPDFRF